jgi:hypothetical protein
MKINLKSAKRRNRLNVENKSKDKEKLDAEIARSLSVVKLKEARKQIEDVEKLRKKSAILSINQRLDFSMRITKEMVDLLIDMKKDYPEALFDSKISPEFVTESVLGTVLQTYESIRFDLQRNIDVKNEDFERLFPRPIMNFDSWNQVINTLGCILMQMHDMKMYCLRLL